MPHEILIAKFYAYGFSEKSVFFGYQKKVYSCQERQKQDVKNDDIPWCF